MNKQTLKNSYKYFETNKVKSFYSKNENTVSVTTIEENIKVETKTTVTSVNNNNNNKEEEEEEDDEEYEEDSIRDIYLLSDFPFTISIHNITLGQFAKKYFTVNRLSSGFFFFN
jgi:hypothetical protein